MVLVRLGLILLPRLSRKALLRLSHIIAHAANRFAGSLHRVGRANLDLAYGDTLTSEEKESILRQSLETFILAILDVFWFSRDTESRVKQYVTFDPSAREALREEAHVCVTAHLGNWEVLGHAMAVAGYPMVSVAAPLANPGVEGVFQAIREKAGQQVVSRTGAVKALLRALRNKGKIGLLLDQNTKPSEGGTFVDFFGVPVTVSQAAAFLAARTGAAIYLGFCVPQPDGSYIVHAPAGRVAPGLDEKAMTTRITEVIEDTIREHPGMWLWSYKRWKLIPDGDDATRFPFYARTLRPDDL